MAKFVIIEHTVRYVQSVSIVEGEDLNKETLDKLLEGKPNDLSCELDWEDLTYKEGDDVEYEVRMFEDWDGPDIDEVTVLELTPELLKALTDEEG